MRLSWNLSPIPFFFFFFHTGFEVFFNCTTYSMKESNASLSLSVVIYHIHYYNIYFCTGKNYMTISCKSNTHSQYVCKWNKNTANWLAEHFVTYSNLLLILALRFAISVSKARWSVISPSLQKWATLGMCLCLVIPYQHQIHLLLELIINTFIVADL